MKKTAKRIVSLILPIIIMLAIIPINFNINAKAESIFNSFSLSDTELRKIASLCQQEQGTAKGAAAEASLMANRYDLYGRSKYGSIYDYVRNCRWWAKAGTYMDKMNASSSVVNEVRSVLIDGKRTIPGYVDEHDYIGDISSCSNNGNNFNKKDKSQYIQFVTVIKNTMGAVYTYYCHPDTNSDPFGYTNSSKRASIGDKYYDYNTKQLVGGVECTCNDSYAGDYIVITESSDLNIRSGESTSSSVIGKIPKGTTVHVSKGNEKWLYVENYNGISGHVYSKYMQKVDVTPPVPQGKEMSESEAAGQTIPDGDYWIYSALNYNYAIDLSGDEIVPSGDNVHMWLRDEDFMPTKFDVWTITYCGNGFYKLRQKDNNVCLDVSGASLDRGANVQVYEDNGSTAQQWSIARTDTGYKLQSRCSGYCLDVEGGVVNGGVNVQVWESNDTGSQRFLFVPYGDDTSRTIKDGVYSIRSGLDNNFCIDVSGTVGKSEYKDETNIQLWQTDTCDDLFYVKYISDGYYKISELSTGLSINIWNGDSTYAYVNRNIQLFSQDDHRNSRWMIKDNGDGTYTLFSKLNGYCVDLSGGICEEGKNIAQYYYNGTNAQKWNFVSIEPSKIKIINLPAKTKYYVGDKLKTEGISVKLIYPTGTYKDISSEVTYKYDFSKSGTSDVTVSYAIDDTTFTASFKVDVINAPFKGKGTEDNPYLISNKNDLKNMRDLINDENSSVAFRECSYLQTADIDLKSEQWIPIGKRLFNDAGTDRLFSGHYNGNNHTIYGLYVNETSKFAGLFGSMGTKKSVIENLAVEGTVISTDISVGGICGEICGKNCIIQNCSFIGDVIGGEQAIGGVVGYIWQSGSIINCYHNGSVISNDGKIVGGVVGNIHTGASEDLNKTLIQNCYHVGTINGASDAMGTIAGIISVDSKYESDVTIENCYALQGELNAIGSGKANKQDITLLKPILMKKAATSLGSAYKDNIDTNFNNGYPIFKWQNVILGDCNNDGEFTIADVVILQKWLLSVPNTKIADQEAADLCKDGKLNVCDLTLMKQLLLK